MLAAVEMWTLRNHAAEWQSWLDKLAFIAKQVASIATVETHVEEPTGLSNVAPTLVIRWDPATLHITGEEVAEDFARKRPRIAVGSQDQDDSAAIRITPSQMQPGHEQIVAERIVQILTAARTPKPTQLAPATVNLSGHWDLTVE